MKIRLDVKLANLITGYLSQWNNGSLQLLSHLIWQDTFAALKHRNFRLWFGGQLVSLIGTWMQVTAQGFLVYELTKSNAYLGYVGFANGLPSWLFMLYGGIVADRLSRRTLLVITQSAMLVLAFILAVLFFTGVVQPWHIILMAFLLGIANAFDAPARQSFVVELVGREDLANAIALNSTMFNSATVIGPMVAGIMYAWLGPGWCFTLNGISFLAVILALSLMRIQSPPKHVQRASAIAQLKEGISYTTSHAVIRTLIIGMGALSIFGISIMTILPAWSVEILGGDAATNGILLSMRGLGSVLGALMIASLGRFHILGKLWTAGNLMMPITIIFFALIHWLPPALLIMVLLGWSFMTQANTANAMIQMQVPDSLRGRVMSVYTLVFFGGMPVGSLFIGSLANIIGAPITLILGAVVLLAFAVYIFVRLPGVRKLT